MPPPTDSGVIPVDVPLRPEELVGAWRPESRRLLLPTREPLRLQQRIAARISAVGLGVAATITGRVTRSSRRGDLHTIEVVPDEVRMRAMERLLSVARGETVRYEPRAPRFLSTMPAVVCGARGSTYMTTFSVSEAGCGLVWSGAVPALGVPIDLRLGAGNRAAALRGVVRWIAQSGRTPIVGVRFVAGAMNAWTMLVADAKRSGAPAA